MRTGSDHDGNIAQVLAAKRNDTPDDVHEGLAARMAALVKAASALVPKA